MDISFLPQEKEQPKNKLLLRDSKIHARAEVEPYWQVASLSIKKIFTSRDLYLYVSR